MTNFTNKLNFSQKEENSTAMKLRNDKDLDYYYNNLCLYCADNDIDITNISDDEFMSAAEVMSNHGENDISTDHYYFWIDA